MGEEATKDCLLDNYLFFHELEHQTNQVTFITEDPIVDTVSESAVVIKTTEGNKVLMLIGVISYIQHSERVFSIIREMLSHLERAFFVSLETNLIRLVYLDLTEIEQSVFHLVVLTKNSVSVVPIAEMVITTHLVSLKGKD